MKKILVIGGGFAGVWSAVGAVRAAREFQASDIEVTLISKDPYLTIRPRLYEEDLSRVRVPLNKILDPVGVRIVQGLVTAIETESRRVTAATEAGEIILPYDRLVMTPGSQVFRPEIPGLRQYAFSVDTYQEAQKLERHLYALSGTPARPGRFTVVVVGGGLTGVETATELVTRMGRRAAEAGEPEAARVVLLDRSRFGESMGPQAKAVLKQAMRELTVDVVDRTALAAVTEAGAVLDGGELIPASTVVWAGGFRANPLTAMVPVERDQLDRLPVDQSLRISGMEGLFAAGDAARAMCDPEHYAVMSCQHAMPQGKIAGYNVVADLLGEPTLTYQQYTYFNCIDLGAWGGLFTEGWDRAVRLQGEQGKQMKQLITHYLIYPPTSGDADQILKAADPRAYLREDLSLNKGLMKWMIRLIPPRFALSYFQSRTV